MLMAAPLLFGQVVSNDAACSDTVQADELNAANCNALLNLRETPFAKAIVVGHDSEVAKFGTDLAPAERQMHPGARNLLEKLSQSTQCDQNTYRLISTFVFSLANIDRAVALINYFLSKRNVAAVGRTIDRLREPNVGFTSAAVNVIIGCLPGITTILHDHKWSSEVAAAVPDFFSYTRALLGAPEQFLTYLTGGAGEFTPTPAEADNRVGYISNIRVADLPPNVREIVCKLMGFDPRLTKVMVSKKGEKLSFRIESENSGDHH
jgi:hypothetical protein